MNKHNKIQRQTDREQTGGGQRGREWQEERNK